MRVLSVIDSLLHGGAETVLVDLVRGLGGHEHRVVHFSGANGAEAAQWIVESLERASIPLHDVHWATLLDPSTRRELLGDGPDVVLHHWWGQDALRRWLNEEAIEAAQRRPRFVNVLHSSRSPAPPGYDAYVLVSATQRPQVGAVDPSRVVVVPNGIDPARFATGAPDAGRPFTIGRISNLGAGKIPSDWIEEAAAFPLNDARFVIAGEGPLLPALREAARRVGAPGRFAFPGYVPREKVPELLATFDVFCYVTSTAVECHPLALLEACAAGLPIVGEARGGIPDIVRDGVNGLLARRRDEVGGLLARLQDDEPLRRRLAAGSRRVAEEFAIDRQVAAYDRLIGSLVR